MVDFITISAMNRLGLLGVLGGGRDDLQGKRRE